LPKLPKYPSCFLGKKRNFFCYDLGIGQNLIEFAKIPIPEFLKYFIIFFFKKNKHNGILKILAGFNSKS